MDEVKRACEENKADVKIPIAEALLVNSGERGITKVPLASSLLIGVIGFVQNWLTVG